MSRFRQPVSAWMESLDRELIRSKHVLLHGNTSDLALYGGMNSGAATDSGCMTFDTALHRYLIDVGFQCVLHFSAADGLRLADPSMADVFSRACAVAPEVSERQSTSSRLNIPGDASGAMDTIRLVLGQNSVSCAVVMQFVDKLVGDAQHHAAEELPLLVRMKQALQDASFASNQTNLRNTFIGVASELTAVPGWLYVDNPRITLVTVSRPNARERRHWIGARLEGFHGASDLESNRQEELVRELADRTDGMSLFDISLLPRVSHAEQIELATPHELVRAARFGKKEDPWRELDPTRLESAERLLGSRVKGQDAAVSHVATTLHQAYVGIGLGSNRAHGGPPKGVFFFVGPTGVGKTELAKSLAELVFGDDDRMKVFDMAEFQLEQAGDRLAGSPPGFVGYERGGQLTNHVLSEPFGVILFDEMEKAHRSVNDKFLGILEEGRLTDGRGMTAYFDQSILVFTSNIGSDRLMTRLRTTPNEVPDYKELRKIFLQAVEDHFAQELKRPELLGRFGDNIIVFDMLRPELIVQLCAKFLAELRANARQQQQIELQIDEPSVAAYLSNRMREPENLALGGRRIRELIVTAVIRPLNDYVFKNKPPSGSYLHLSVDPSGGRISIKTRQ